jgi:hypothetical protein
VAEPRADSFQTFDEASLAVLAALIRDHRQAALATVDGGAPYTAMTAYVPEPGFAGFLVHLSDLAPHKAHLRADPAVSLIIFEPDDGRTEILQHKRASFECRAEVVPKGTAAYDVARERYLQRFPKHALMFALQDFDLVRLVPRRGLLNAGFGRAYQVTPADLAAAAQAGGGD